MVVVITLLFRCRLAHDRALNSDEIFPTAWLRARTVPEHHALVTTNRHQLDVVARQRTTGQMRPAVHTLTIDVRYIILSIGL